MTAEKTPKPARIHLQVREGALNELIAFDLETTEAAELNENGTKDHAVNSLSIVEGLARAQRKLILEVREADPNRADVEIWLDSLFDWVIAE